MPVAMELCEITFSERFNELKKSSGKTIADISNSTGINYDLISSYLQGRRNPSAANLFKLSKCFGVSCESFMECEETESKQATKRKRK